MQYIYTEICVTFGTLLSVTEMHHVCMDGR